MPLSGHSLDKVEIPAESQSTEVVQNKASRTILADGLAFDPNLLPK